MIKYFFKLPICVINLIYEYEGNILNIENKKKCIENINNNIFNPYNNYLLDFSYQSNKIQINNKLTNILKNISLDLTKKEKNYIDSYSSKSCISFNINDNYINNIINTLIDKIKNNIKNIKKTYNIVIYSKINGSLNVKIDNSKININSIDSWKKKILYIINKNIDIYFDILIINNSITLIINRIIFI